jgi:hypothetical protein
MSNRYVIVAESGPDEQRGVDAVYGNAGRGFTGEEVLRMLDTLRKHFADNRSLVKPTVTAVKLLDIPVDADPVRIVSRGTVAFGGRSYAAELLANGQLRYSANARGTAKRVATPQIRETFRARESK